MDSINTLQSYSKILWEIIMFIQIKIYSTCNILNFKSTKVCRFIIMALNPASLQFVSRTVTNPSEWAR